MLWAWLGGIIRDVLLNNVPMAFRKEIYICASLMGALVYCFITVVACQITLNQPIM